MNFEKLASQTFVAAMEDVAARFIATKYVGPFEKTAGLGDLAAGAQEWWGKQDPMLQKSLIGGGVGALGGALLGGAASTASGRPRPLRSALMAGLLGGGVGALGGAAAQALQDNREAANQAMKLRDAGQAIDAFNKTQEANPMSSVRNGDLLGTTEKAINATVEGGKAVVSDPASRASVLNHAIGGAAAGGAIGGSTAYKMTPPVATGGEPMVAATRVKELLGNPANKLTPADFSASMPIKHLVGDKVVATQAHLPLTAAGKAEALLKPVHRPVAPALRGGAYGSGVGAGLGALLGLGRQGIQQAGDPGLKALAAVESQLALHPEWYSADVKNMLPDWKAPAGATAGTSPPDSTFQYLLNELRKHTLQKQGGVMSTIGEGVGTGLSHVSSGLGDWWNKQDPTTQNTLIGGGLGALGGGAVGLMAPKKRLATAGLLGLLGGAAGAAGGHFLGGAPTSQPSAAPSTPAADSPPPVAGNAPSPPPVGDPAGAAARHPILTGLGGAAAYKLLLKPGAKGLMSPWRSATPAPAGSRPLIKSPGAAAAPAATAVAGAKQPTVGVPTHLASPLTQINSFMASPHP